LPASEGSNKKFGAIHNEPVPFGRVLTLLPQVGSLSGKWHFFMMAKLKIAFGYLNV